MLEEEWYSYHLNFLKLHHFHSLHLFGLQLVIWSQNKLVSFFLWVLLGPMSVKISNLATCQPKIILDGLHLVKYLYYQSCPVYSPPGWWVKWRHEKTVSVVDCWENLPQRLSHYSLEHSLQLNPKLFLTCTIIFTNMQKRGIAIDSLQVHVLVNRPKVYQRSSKTRSIIIV